MAATSTEVGSASAEVKSTFEGIIDSLTECFVQELCAVGSASSYWTFPNFYLTGKAQQIPWLGRIISLQSAQRTASKVGPDRSQSSGPAATDSLAAKARCGVITFAANACCGWSLQNLIFSCFLTVALWFAWVPCTCFLVQSAWCQTHMPCLLCREAGGLLKAYQASDLWPAAFKDAYVEFPYSGIGSSDVRFECSNAVRNMF